MTGIWSNGLFRGLVISADSTFTVREAVGLWKPKETEAVSDKFSLMAEASIVRIPNDWLLFPEKQLIRLVGF